MLDQRPTPCHSLFVGETVHACIEAHVQAAPDAHCFSLRAGNTWQAVTRAQYWQRVEHYARLFHNAFTTPSLILFIKRLDLDLLAAYIGAMKAGHLPAQLSPFSNKTSENEYARKIVHILDLTGARGIFTDTSEAAKIAARPQLTLLTPDSPVEGDDAPPGSGRQALVQFSSGSTGLQKGVVLSHAGILAHMRHYGAALALTPQDKLVSWLPLYHDMGLIACYLMPLMAGIPFFQMDPFEWIMRPDLLLEVIEEQRATLCFLPNFAYHVLINKGKPRNLSSMRLFVNCSEPAKPQTHEAFRQKFSSLRPGVLSVCYALAENTFAVTQTPLGLEAQTLSLEGKTLHSCGRILPETEVRILEPDATGVGEIGIRGAYLFDEFLGSSRPLEDGFYRTGDLGFVSADGELYVTGRKKDLIISNGKNIYPQDIEHACSQVPGVYPGRVVAFGVDSEQTGSEDLFVVVERDGSVADTPLKLTVQKAIEAEVGVLPKRVEVVDHMRLVKTSSGKISRARNKELFLSGELR